uniref:ABC-type xenobiotic transporter n=1 Tax=Ascaris lumbricoides TaxID=6252 RepID=A0A0M3HS88_ASCLU
MDWQDVITFCGFNSSANSYVTRYVLNASARTLTPCAEFTIVTIQNIPLFYLSITTLFILQSFRRIITAGLWYLTVSKMALAVAVVLVYGLNIFLGVITKYPLRAVILIEYSIVSLVWLTFALLWLTSLNLSVWIRSGFLLTAYSVASLSFALITLERWLQFGIYDVRTFLPLSIASVHVSSALIYSLEWRMSERYSRMALLESDTSLPDDVVRLSEGGDQNAAFFSRIFFCWSNDLIRKGYRMQLNELRDLFTLPSCLETAVVEKEFVESASTRFVDAEDFSLTKALLRAFGAPFFALGALKLISDALTFAGPILLHLLVVCLDDEQCEEDGYNYSLLMMLATFLSAIASSNFNYYITKIGLKLRSAISTALYDKLLRVRLSTLSSFSSGQILNFMSTDVDRIVNMCSSFHAFWSLPLQLGVALYLLYREVGLAFLSGLIASLLLVPLNKWITSAIGRLSEKMMQCKDQRVKLVSETVRAIRTVKLSNWERNLERRITALRENELHYLKGRKYLDAVCVYLWASAPILITIAIFSTYTVLLHEKLTAAKVFTSLALVNILIMPLNAFPWVLSGLVEAFVSIRRLDKFFDLENIDIATLYSLTTDLRQPLQITDATFSWQDGFSVKNVTLDGNAGTVIGLVGPVGSGKSTFLLGILGETDVVARHIGIRQNTVHEGFAYVSQSCWLRRGTVRENIVCGAEFDVRFYEEVIRVTALKPDIQASRFACCCCRLHSAVAELLTRVPNVCLTTRGAAEFTQLAGRFCGISRSVENSGKLTQTHYSTDCLPFSSISRQLIGNNLQAMPGGDEYEVGDGGCTLSGGQRARVALARALYQGILINREVYLLDDPFASVDAKVGRWMWDEAVMRMLRARGKLVIVATHHVDYLKDADHIIVLDGHGNILKQGPSLVILQDKLELQASSPLDFPENVAETESVEQVAIINEEKQASFYMIAGTIIMTKYIHFCEYFQHGKVRLSVYGAYMRAAGVLLSIAILAALAAMQTSKNVADWWLSRWASQCNFNETNTSVTFDRQMYEIDQTTAVLYDYRFLFGERVVNNLKEEEWNTTVYFLVVYAALALSNTLFTLMRAFIFAYGGIVAARNLHRRLLHRVLNASISWWERTPSGRVINRLCADVYTVDDSLPFQFNIFLASSFNLLGSIVLTFIALPFLSPVIAGLFIIYFFVQRYYRYTTCEVKRVTSLSLSPLYSHITDTISGLSTIRAFRFVDDFASTLRDRLGDNIRAQFSALAAAQWLSVRLQILGVFMVSAVTLSAVLHRTLHYVDTGMVGLAITYALSATNLLNSLLSSFIETEKELISVERMAEYTKDIPLESNNFPIPMNSDVNGRIDFACVSLRYGVGLPLALENVSFRIEAGTRVAIIGRTGSGKSSLIQALLRTNPISMHSVAVTVKKNDIGFRIQMCCDTFSLSLDYTYPHSDSGRIFIDGIDIYSVELHSLRSIFGIVTQTPFVFSGTLRENLCLEHDIPEEELQRMAEIANFGCLVERLGGFDGVIEEGGANLSFGEKQIISICRLILSRPKIVIFDEATAHMDSLTHTRMSELVRCLLPTVTVISIIHRTHDINSYDSVILMECGKIAWQGPPDNLRENSDDSYC